MSEKKRWQYRFDNFGRAFVLLREAMDALETRQLNQLEREGIIQRFEYTWELAWKTLADYLSNEGIHLETVTPRTVIREAFAVNIIARGEDWMAALDARNKMSHTYSFTVFEKIIADIRTTYFSLFDELYDYLMTKALDNANGAV